MADKKAMYRLAVWTIAKMLGQLAETVDPDFGYGTNGITKTVNDLRPYVMKPTISDLDIQSITYQVEEFFSDNIPLISKEPKIDCLKKVAGFIMLYFMIGDLKLCCKPSNDELVLWDRMLKEDISRDMIKLFERLFGPNFGWTEGEEYHNEINNYLNIL